MGFLISLSLKALTVDGIEVEAVNIVIVAMIGDLG
jgi:hypothetical protein